MKRFIIPVFALLVAISVFAVSCTTEDVVTLLRVANTTEGLESLVNVISAIEENASEDPGFTDALGDESLTLTVFAPNNAAFVALFNAIKDADEASYTVDANGDGIIEGDDINNFIGSIISLGLANDIPEVIDFLIDVVSLHLIAGEKLMATDVVAADGSAIGPTLLEGVSLDVSVSGSVVTLTPDSSTSTAADIAATDVEAANGVAHVLSGVLLPLSLVQ